MLSYKIYLQLTFKTLKAGHNTLAEGIQIIKSTLHIF